MSTIGVKEDIIISISDYKIGHSPNILITYALGSCVGVGIYDEMASVAGLAHIMLPYNKKGDADYKKYADTAITMMVNELLEKGANKSRLKAKIAGGAHVIKNMNLFAIGYENILATKNILKNINIPIVAEDTGGEKSRTVSFDLKTFNMNLKKIKENKIYYKNI